MNLTLSERTDAFSFHPGMPCVMNPDGSLRPATRMERVKFRIAAAWRRVTWWRQHRVVVGAVDHEAGSVTMVSLRWSWRRWKWVALGIAALLIGCGGANLREPAARPTPWCFAVGLRGGDSGLACSGRRSTCERARSNAIAFAGVAGIEAVGVCGLERPQP